MGMQKWTSGKFKNCKRGKLEKKKLENCKSTKLIIFWKSGKLKKWKVGKFKSRKVEI